MAKSCLLLYDVTSSHVGVPNNSYLIFVPINLRSRCSRKWKCLVHINPDIIEAAYFYTPILPTLRCTGPIFGLWVAFLIRCGFVQRIHWFRANDSYKKNSGWRSEQNVGKRAHHGQLEQARLLNKRKQASVRVLPGERRKRKTGPRMRW